MGYIIRTDDGEGIRHEMRRNMRMGNYRHDGYPPMMHGGSYEDGYRLGYRHGVEDHEDEMEMRRRRDSMGLYT